ncbi:MAG TPA: alpha/beta hydrolase [Myxococcaceae bacterium]|nr:alpha/beta hydrolase [Myxococcaceae bacterium]
MRLYSARLARQLRLWERTLPSGGASRHPDQVVSRWTRVGNLRIHHRASTHPVPPDAPTVVLVHGMVVSSRYMVPTLLLLARSARVLAPDLPGYGLSDDPPRPLKDVSALADALAEWMEAAGLERAVLLGNSLGCQTLAAFGVRHPERTEGLVLQGPTTDPEARTAWKQIARWLANGPRERPLQLPIMVRDYWEAGFRRSLLTLRMALEHPIEDELPHIQAPTLVVRGSRDPIVPQRWAEQVARLLPRGRLVVIPGGAHTVNFSAPLELVRVVEPFLRELRAGAGSERTAHP